MTNRYESLEVRRTRENIKTVAHLMQNKKKFKNPEKAHQAKFLMSRLLKKIS